MRVRVRRFKLSHKKKKVIKDLLFILFVYICITLMYAYQIFPALSVSCATEINNKMSKIINDSVLDYISENGDTSPYINIKYTNDGKVSSVDADVNRINITRANISRKILDTLDSNIIKSIRLPFGCIIDNELLYAKGPMLTFKVISNEGFVSKVDSEFKEMGVNQTLHKLYLSFNVIITVSLPGKNEKYFVEYKYPLSEIVIVGDVPDAYTKINRFFDDLSESEIDDIYDFGAS